MTIKHNTEDLVNQCQNPIWLKTERIFVGCGKCEFCRKVWKNEWAKRLEIQKNISYLTLAMTLTYEDEHLPYKNGVPTLSKDDVQKFFKRVRKETSKLYPDVSYQYFISGEYGHRNFRPHFHLILFVNTNNHTYTKYDFQTIALNKWRKGYIYYDEVKRISVKYLAKYIGKSTGISDYADRHGIPKPFVLMSRRPAIANKYLELGNNFEYHFKTLEHCKIAMPGMGQQILPRYLRKIIYQHYPKHLKQDYYFKLQQLKKQQNENKIRESARHLRLDRYSIQYDNRLNPNLDHYRQIERCQQKSREIENENYIKLINQNEHI